MFFLYSPYKAFISLLIYLYICFIKFADTIQKKSVDWCKFAIQLQVAGLSTFGDTVGNFLKFHYTGKIWKIHFTGKYFPNVCFCERLFYYQCTP